MGDRRRVGRRTVEISNPEKLLFEEDGISKTDLIDYYEAVSGFMMRHVKDRLVSMERYPDGIVGKRFFTKDVPDYFPGWIDTKTVSKQRGTVTHVVCNQRATFVYLANQACITPHVGLSLIDRLDHPDQVIFDLDPSADDFKMVRDVAVSVRELFEDVGLVPFVKSTGSKGLHVMAPLDRRADFAHVRRFARDVARVVADSDPRRVTLEQRKDKRKGRLFLDWLRNAYGQTAAAPYAVRARPGAPVAVPLEWDEIEERGFHPRRYSMKDALRRVEDAGDPWRTWKRRARSLARARARLDELMSES